jgi:long-chain acyl-CoA synthetase
MDSNPGLKTVPEYFTRSCEQFPWRSAQRFNAHLYGGDNNGRYTYAEMRTAAERIAAGLMSLGLGKQDRVALMSRTTPYWTQADMGVAMAAGVVGAVYSTLSAGEAGFIASDSGSRYLFADTGENLGKILSVKRELPKLEKIVVMDFDFTGGGEGVITLVELMDKGKEWLKEHRGLLAERMRGIDPDDPYTILYTPGAAGRGRGAALTHRTVSSRIEGAAAFFARYGMDVTHDDVTLCSLPLPHIFERGTCQLLAISRGACIAYADKPGTILQDMQRYSPTWINCGPGLYEKVRLSFQEMTGQSPLKKRLFDMALQVGRKALDYRRDHRGTYNMSPSYELVERLPWDLKLQYRIADRLFSQVRALFGKRFRFAISAGAGIPPDQLLFFYSLGLGVVEGYGSPETAGACLLNPLTSCKPGCMGIEACGSSVRIAGDGGLEVSGAGIFAGYPGLPEDTKEAFTGDGWFKTGDLARTDDYGYYRMAEGKKAAAEDFAEAAGGMS